MQVSVKQKKQILQVGKTKRADLTRQFEQFKQKIQEFDQKNQQIISKIREAYHFKKRNLQEGHQTSNRVIYYERGDQAQSVTTSNDFSKNIVYDGNLIPYSAPSCELQQPQTSTYPHPPFHPAKGSAEKNVRMSSKSSRVQVPKEPLNQASPLTYSDYTKMQQRNEMIQPQLKIRTVLASPPRQLQAEQQWQFRWQQLSNRNTQLEQLMQEKEEEIKKMKKQQLKFKGYLTSVKRMVTEKFQNFHQEKILQQMLYLQKHVKQCDNKLKNLTFRLKDAIEDRKAHRIISRSREKRRSAKKESKNSQYSSFDMKESNMSSPKQRQMRGSQMKLPNKSVTKTESNRQQQFTQIAKGYQSMIKAKAEEVQRIETQLRNQTLAKGRYAEQLAKAKTLLEQKDKHIQQFHSSKQIPNGSQQLKEFKVKVTKLEDEIKAKDQKQKELSEMIQKIDKSKKTIIEEQKDSFNKSIAKKNTTISQLQVKLNESQTCYLKQIAQLKEKLMSSDKKIMQKDCENLSLINKLKKLESDALLKDQQIKELQYLISKENEQDVLEKSMSMDASLLTPHEIRVLQETLRQLEDENDRKTSTLEELQTHKYKIETENAQLTADTSRQSHLMQELQKRIEDLERQVQGKELANEKQLSRHVQGQEEAIQQLQKQKAELIEEKEMLTSRNNQLIKDIKKLKEENLAVNRQLIKKNSELNFKRDEYANLQQKFIQSKEEVSEFKNKRSLSLHKAQERQKKLKIENQQIKNINLHLEQLMVEMESKNSKPEDENLLHSMNISEISFNMLATNRGQEEELTLLRQRMRQLEMSLQSKENMEKQIETEYKQNLEKIKKDLADKSEQIKKVQTDNENYRKQLKILQQQQMDDHSFDNYKITIYEDKILQMEAGYNSTKQSEHRLNELLHQLTENMKEKSLEREKLLQQLEEKEKALEEVKELIQLRQAKEEGTIPVGSREMILGISADHSQEMSELAEMSCLSNISDVFKRDEVLQEKMRKGKTTRQEFIKLFTKTSAYIKSLKAIITSKDNRINNLERQVLNFKIQNKSTMFHSTEVQKNKGTVEPKEKYVFRTEEIESANSSFEQYKDYDSVQIDSRRSRPFELLKELQHQKALAIEENKMLLNQIELMQDELTKAEQQENSLVKIKDLYKDQISKLMKKNEEHTRQFSTQIKNLRDELDQSEAYHNWEALKQLVAKIVNCIGWLEDQTNKSKRDEKMRELQEFVKVVLSILKVDIGVRDKLMANFKR